MGSGLFFVAGLLFASGAAGYFTIYQYRRGAAFNLRHGWQTRKDSPAGFWVGVISTGLVALMPLTVVLVALFQL